VTVDAIGPRSNASVRTALRRHEDELAACRREEDALVRIAFSIAPDGSVMSARAVQDPDLAEDATDCVLASLPSWPFASVRAGTTSVVWSFTLRGTASDPAMRTCWCFHWVHLGDHGLDCAPSEAACERGRAQRGRSGDSMPCESSRRPVCDRDGYVDGEHIHSP
jgi:hypothetical protein